MSKSLQQILEKPTSVDKIHESCFRSYHTLEYVLAMVERGDSQESIMEVAALLQSSPLEHELL